MIPSPVQVIQVEWGRLKGWLRVRDPATGEWHEIQVKDALPCWKDELFGRRKRWEAR